MVLDKEPLQRLLVKVASDSDSTHWAEGMVTLDSVDSISVISRNFAALSNITVEKLSHSLQLLNASSEEMVVDGVIYPQISLTNGQQQQLGAVVVSPDLSTEQFLVCTSDMIKLQILPNRWPFHRKSGGLNNVGNKSWKPIQVNNSNVSTSYFKSVQNVDFVKNVELESQPQFVFNSCFGFRAKFQNNSVAEVSNFCNHEKLNNVSNCFVNSDIIEISSYNSVMSVNARPNVSTELGQQTDHIQSDVEISTTLMKPVPSLLFEASGKFFGVVYNDVLQETSCDSNTSCVTVSALEGTSKVAISKSSTSKNESFKNETLQNV